ncbi:hypothetical protein VZT92_001915 [Zoarces viviparus]|uniref:Uncharacterized protein n=1 Tax=Zoarces viviparus TaxID=48416 RepID=A0AAW1G6U3_ZOAVI
MIIFLLIIIFQHVIAEVIVPGIFAAVVVLGVQLKQLTHIDEHLTSIHNDVPLTSTHNDEPRPTSTPNDDLQFTSIHYAGLHLTSTHNARNQEITYLVIVVEDPDDFREAILCRTFDDVQRRRRAQQLLARASKALAEAVSLCLQHKLPSSILADASLNMVECHGQSDPAASGCPCPVSVESDNKKETKGSKGNKGKADQRQAIKVIPVNRVLPSNTFPVDTRRMKYIVDLYNEGNFEGTSLSVRMKEMLENHSEHCTHVWEGFMGSRETPSVSEMEQLLRRCSAFIYLGMESFMANVPPAKLAAFNMSGTVHPNSISVQMNCRLALLFDLTQNSASVLRQSNLDMSKSAAQLDLEKPLETALLLSLCGVGCIVLHQWHSSLQHDAQCARQQTSGQTVHALRRGDGEVTGSHDTVHPTRILIQPHIGISVYYQVLRSDSEGDDARHKTTLAPAAFNCIVYGLPNLIVM